MRAAPLDTLKKLVPRGASMVTPQPAEPLEIPVPTTTDLGAEISTLDVIHGIDHSEGLGAALRTARLRAGLPSRVRPDR